MKREREYDIPFQMLRAAVMGLLRDGSVKTMDAIRNALCPFVEDPTGRAAARLHAGVLRLLEAGDLELVSGEGFRRHPGCATAASCELDALALAMLGGPALRSLLSGRTPEFGVRGHRVVRVAISNVVGAGAEPTAAAVRDELMRLGDFHGVGGDYLIHELERRIISSGGPASPAAPPPPPASKTAETIPAYRAEIADTIERTAVSWGALTRHEQDAVSAFARHVADVIRAGGEP